MENKLNKSKFKKGCIPWNKGKKGVMPIPWNKGKTFNRIIIKCEICDKEFSIIKSYLNNRNRRFCSADCRNKWFAKIPKYKKCYELLT